MEPIYKETVALLFGATIVVLFSYERFNRTSYKTGPRMERLVALLSPEKLRARKVVLRVWFYYCVGLLILYATLCIYFDVLKSFIGLEDTTVAGGAADSDAKTIGIPPEVSLSIALVLTGLAPSVPVLKRFEEWGRITAHRIAGIPTRVLNDTDVLRRKAMNLTKRSQDSLMISKGDWERHAHYRAAASNQVSDPEDFSRDIYLIISVSAWILERNLELQNASFRENFEAIEEELRKRKGILFLELDERTEFTLGGLVRSEPDTVGESVDITPTELKNASELKRKSWARVASDVDNLAEDMCILLALYVEHGLVPNVDLGNADTPHFLRSDVKSRNAIAERKGDSDPAQYRAVRQHDIAADKLSHFLEDIGDNSASHVQQSSFGMNAYLWSAALIMVVTIAWSLGPGQYELGLRFSREFVPWTERFSRFTIIAINGLLLPLAVFLLLRDAAKQADRWSNVWRVHWTTWFPRIGGCLLLSWLVSMLVLIAVSLWILAIQGKLGSIGTWTNITAIYERESLVILRGCLLGLIVVLLLDGRAARIPSLGRTPSWKSSMQWGLISALVTATTGALARAIQSLTAARRWGREGLDNIDMGLLFYSSLYSALIGFFVVFILSEVLLNQRPIKKRGGARLVSNPAE